MCRQLAWLGTPRSVASLVLDPPCGLLRQSYAPRRQKRGLVNADGWGVGFYPAGQSAPVRWRSARPLWGDSSFASVAPVLSSHAVLAAVRSATVGMPIEESASAPFTDGTWLLSHNGRVDRSVLPASAAVAAESSCDAARLAAHVFKRGADSLVETITDVARRDPGAVLTVLMTDGARVLGITWADTLSYLAGSDGVAVASEPWDDDPRWVDIPDRHLIEVTSTGVTVTDLEVT
ncbi:MAG: ergothioneine biosynthesis protein EgtC [Actinomycetota bacterium]|nr:ergothioneine biosynthesis protein EgtC [Actinomycetota bacterium]